MENLKKAVERLISTAMVVDGAMADQKIDTFEWVKIAGSTVGWIWIVRNLKIVVEDVRNMDDVKAAELHAHVVEVFDIRNDVAEKVIEEAVGIILMFATMVGDIKPVE